MTGLTASLLYFQHRYMDERVATLSQSGSVAFCERVAFAALLTQHMDAEEAIIFPFCSQAGFVAAINILTIEHHQMRAILKMWSRGDEQGKEQSMPASELSTLLQILHQHNQKEETMIYDRLETIRSIKDSRLG